MTPLRQRMIEDMQLNGLSASTQECYVNAVRGLAGYFHRSPDKLCEEELRDYFLYLAHKKKVARSSATVAICGIKFLFEQRPCSDSGPHCVWCGHRAGRNCRWF